MITYRPEAKELVYQELEFISSVAGSQQSMVASYDRIFEEVAFEIFNEFVEPMMTVQLAQEVSNIIQTGLIELLS